MTRWFAWFQGERDIAYFRLLIADSLEVAEMMANDLASRDKTKLIGIIVAPGQFDPEKKILD